MIDRLKPYSEYRYGSAPRLWDSLPEHWTVNRLRHAAELLVSNVDKHSHEGEVPARLCNYVDVYKNRRITDRLAFMRATATPDEVHRFRIRIGDVLITKDSEAWNDIGVPALVEHEAPDLLCGYHLAILRPRADRLIGGYLLYALCAHTIAAQFHTEANGVTRYGLSHGAIKDIVLPLPPLTEQAGIVRFLGALDRKVNRFIRAKRRLIEVLTEQKQAIITHAVTKGLNPHAPLKPSGIDWLGDVPEHWEVKRVKQAANILRGKFTHRPRNDPSFYDGPYPFIQTGGVAQADKYISTWSQTLNERGLSVSKLFPAGTLVMTIAANIGDVAVLAIEACFPDSVVGFVPSAGINRDYMYLVFRCMKPILLREAPVNTQGNLNVERIGAMGVPIPPTDEQESIVARTEQDTAQIDASIAAIKREIDLIREYRTRLVADVVTGKVDVRAAAAAIAATDDAEPPDCDVVDLEDDAGEKTIDVVQEEEES